MYKAKAVWNLKVEPEEQKVDFFLTKPDILQIKLHTDTNGYQIAYTRCLEDISAYFRCMDIEINICEEEVQSGNTK